MFFLKITNVDGTQVFIPNPDVIQIVVTPDSQTTATNYSVSRPVQGSITEVAYLNGAAAASQTIVRVTTPLYNGSNIKYEFGIQSLDGTFAVMMSNTLTAEALDTPALSLNFMNDTLDPRITFTRASAGTHFDSSGRLVVDGYNLLLRSEDLLDAVWTTRTNCAAVLGAADPLGGSTAWTITASGVSAAYQQVVTGVSSAPYTTSIWVRRRAGSGVIQLRASELSGSSIAITTSWQRFSLTNTSTTTIIRCAVTMTNADDAIDIWQPQLEQSTTASQYSPTTTTANSGPRFDYDPVTLAPRGLLIEEARTNTVLYSRDITNAWWGTKTDLTVSKDQIGIDGIANSACKLTEGTANTAVLLATPTVAAGSVITQSCYVKAVSGVTWVRISPGDSTGTDYATAWFNLVTGVKGGLSTNGAATQAASTITDIGNGWYRITCTVLPNGSYTAARFVLAPATSDGAATRPGNSVMIMDCAQLEVGGYATSPIHTTTTTVARAGDIAQMTGADFSNWYNQSQGTFIAEFTRFGFDGSAGSVVVVQADDFTSNNRIALRLAPRSAVTTPQGTIVAGGVVLVNDGLGALVSIDNIVQKYALAYQIGVSATARNGAVNNIASVASLPTVLQLQIGSGPSASALQGHIRSIQYFNVRVPNGTLAKLTT
jgi:hypothetical protein